MEIIFLGTAAGKPTLERNPSALAIKFEQDSKWSLFDCAEATQHQIMKSPLSISKIDKIFITHLHGDHFFGLLGILSTRKMEEINSKLTIFAPKGIKEFLETTAKISQIDLSNIDIIEINKEDTYSLDNFDIEVVELSHSIDSFAFIIKEHQKAPKLNVEKLKEHNIPPSPIYSKIKTQEKVILDDNRVIYSKEFLLPPPKPRKIIVAGDNDNPYLLYEHMKNADLLIHEATYTQEVFDLLTKKQRHTTAKSLALAANKANLKNLIATHISGRYTLKEKKNSKHISQIENELKNHFKGVCFVAKDFDKYYLTKEGKLIKDKT
ncbi:MAG: ribonuclease Z [Epsilonproteobacteria bacterium]|nr:ribonuclease Z [Campylobacterota bacterium]